MRTWLIIALLTAMALSGCAGEDPQNVDDAGPSDDGDADGDGGNETAGGFDSGGESTGNGTGNATKEVPVVTFTADVINGTAPLRVNFTLSVDDDSESIAWAFLIDGNETLTGTEVPAAFNHTFEADTWNVTVSVDDGEHVVEEAFTIHAVEDVGLAVPDVVFEGEVLIPDPWAVELNGCLLDAGRRDAGGPQGITGTRHDLDATMFGRSYSFDIGGVIAEFWGDGILGAGSSGVVPDDAEYLVVCINDPEVADVDYTLTLTV